MGGGVTNKSVIYYITKEKIEKNKITKERRKEEKGKKGQVYLVSLY